MIIFKLSKSLIFGYYSQGRRGGFVVKLEATNLSVNISCS